MALPYLGGLPGAAAAACVVGMTSGFGNVLLITLLQQWAPAPLLGRVMSLIMVAAWGTLPLSATLAGALVLRYGAAPYFPVAGAVVVVAVLGALTQREFRSLGVAAQLPPGPDEPVNPMGSTGRSETVGDRRDHALVQLDRGGRHVLLDMVRRAGAGDRQDLR